MQGATQLKTHRQFGVSKSCGAVLPFAEVTNHMHHERVHFIRKVVKVCDSWFVKSDEPPFSWFAAISSPRPNQAGGFIASHLEQISWVYIRSRMVQITSDQLDNLDTKRKLNSIPE